MMKINKTIFYSLLLAFLLTACGKGEKERRKINPNIINLTKQEPQIYTNTGTAIWIDNYTIYSTFPLAKITLDNEFKVTNFSKLTNGMGVPTCSNELRDKFLLIHSGRYLYEYNINTNLAKEIIIEIEITKYYNIKGAQYYKDNQIIYCTNYFDSIFEQEKTNYYIYDRTTKENKFLLTTNRLKCETDLIGDINGFDIHPQKNKLLIPLENNSLLEYNISEGLSKILHSNIRIYWVRYNKTGDKILHSDWNKMGILDLETLKSKELDANTSPYQNREYSVIYPSWSPNEKHIIFGSTYANYHDNIFEPYELYILKNVN